MHQWLNGLSSTVRRGTAQLKTKRSSGTSVNVNGASVERKGRGIASKVDWSTSEAIDSPIMRELFDILHVFIVPALALGGIYGVWTSGIGAISAIQCSFGILIATVTIWKIGEAWKANQLVGAGLWLSGVTYSVAMIDEIVGALAKGTAFAPVIYGKVLVFSWAVIFTLVIATIFALPQTRMKLEKLRLMIKQAVNQQRLKDEKLEDEAEEIRLMLFDNANTRQQAWIIKERYHEQKLKELQARRTRKNLREAAKANTSAEVVIFMTNAQDHGEKRAQLLSAGGAYTKTIGKLAKAAKTSGANNIPELATLRPCPGVHLLDPSTGRLYSRACTKGNQISGGAHRCGTCKRHKADKISKGLVEIQ